MIPPSKLHMLTTILNNTINKHKYIEYFAIASVVEEQFESSENDEQDDRNNEVGFSLLDLLGFYFVVGFVL